MKHRAAKYAHKPALLLAAVFAGSFAAMSGFQELKHLVLPEITLWESHHITDLFVSALVTLAAFALARRMERERQRVSDREKERFGQELHDGFGQLLTGIELKGKALECRLDHLHLPEAAEAHEIALLVNQASMQARDMARALFPVLKDARDLILRLRQLAVQLEAHSACAGRLEADDRLQIENRFTALHLYRIAQEAAHNAIRHGKAKHVVFRLSADGGQGSLTVDDDGAGLPIPPSSDKGIGLHLMEYRARLIGGTLNIAGSPIGGLRVQCLFPLLPEDSN